VTPAEWLGFAADWDHMAERAEWLAACETEYRSRFGESAMQAILLDAKPTIH
jgi:hypothetical protein